MTRVVGTAKPGIRTSKTSGGASCGLVGGFRPPTAEEFEAMEQMGEEEELSAATEPTAVGQAAGAAVAPVRARREADGALTLSTVVA